MYDNNSQISGSFNNEYNRLLAMHQKQIEDNQLSLQEIREQISNIRTDLAVIPEKLSSGSDRLKESVTSLGSRLGSVEERTKSLESDHALLKRDIAFILQLKESQDQVIRNVLITFVGAIIVAVFISHNPFFNKLTPNSNPINSGEAPK